MSAMLGPINELSSAKYTSDPLLDQNGTAIPGSTIGSAKLTLYDLKSGQIINSRDAQNVNQANGVSISDLGVVTWELSPADNVIIDRRVSQEVHVAVFDFSWGQSANRAIHEFRFLVNNVGKVSS